MYGFEDEDTSAMEEFLASSPPAWNSDIPVSFVDIFGYKLIDPATTFIGTYGR